MHVTTFIVRGCKSSHPAALFLELHAILHISSSANTDAKKKILKISDIFTRASFSRRYFIDKRSTNMYEKVSKLLAIIFPTLITSLLHFNSEFSGQ